MRGKQKTGKKYGSGKLSVYFSTDNNTLLPFLSIKMTSLRPKLRVLTSNYN